MSWRRPATASTPSPPSCWPSRSAPRTAGFAGVFSASKLVFVAPDQFLFAVSFTVLAMVVLGGMGNIWGVALGAFIIYVLQTVVLKELNTLFDGSMCRSCREIDFLQYQFLLYGLALVTMMLLRPEGLFPSRRRARSCVSRTSRWGRRRRP